MRSVFPPTGTVYSVAKLLAAGGPLETTLRLAQSILHRLADLLLDDWLVVPTPLKILVSRVGMIIPNIRKKQTMVQTTNQIIFESLSQADVFFFVAEEGSIHNPSHEPTIHRALVTSFAVRMDKNPTDPIGKRTVCEVENHHLRYSALSLIMGHVSITNFYFTRGHGDFQAQSATQTSDRKGMVDSD